MPSYDPNVSTGKYEVNNWDEVNESIAAYKETLAAATNTPTVVSYYLEKINRSDRAWNGAERQMNHINRLHRFVNDEYLIKA